LDFQGFQLHPGSLVGLFASRSSDPFFQASFFSPSAALRLTVRGEEGSHDDIMVRKNGKKKKRKRKRKRKRGRKEGKKERKFWTF
jgi:hypothetical protein